MVRHRHISDRYKDRGLSFNTVSEQRIQDTHEASPNSFYTFLCPAAWSKATATPYQSWKWSTGRQTARSEKRGCRASCCTQSSVSSTFISRLPSSPEGISLLKVILLETRHSCSGLGCLLQPSESLQSHMLFDPLLPGYLPIQCPEDQWVELCQNHWQTQVLLLALEGPCQHHNYMRLHSAVLSDPSYPSDHCNHSSALSNLNCPHFDKQPCTDLAIVSSRPYPDNHSASVIVLTAVMLVLCLI